MGATTIGVISEGSIPLNVRGILKIKITIKYTSTDTSSETKVISNMVLI